MRVGPAIQASTSRKGDEKSHVWMPSEKLHHGKGIIYLDQLPTSPEERGGFILQSFFSLQDAICSAYDRFRAFHIRDTIFGRFTLLPDSRIRKICQLFLAMAIIFQSAVIPFRAVWGFHNWTGIGIWLGIDYALDVVYFFDIWLNFVTSYTQDGTGKLITDRDLIAKKYIKKDFVLHVLASLPLDLLALHYGIDALPWLRMNRILRVVQLSSIFSALEKDTGSAIIRISRLFFVMLLFAHWFGCIWFYIAKLEGLGENTWANHASVEDKDSFTQYITSAYWALVVMTTVGFGDIVPVTNMEKLFTIATMITGVSIYATIFGNMATLIAQMDASATRYREKLDGLHEYMKYRCLPQYLRKRILNYYDVIWSRHKGIDENSILNELPSSLRSEIALYLNRELVENVPLFKGTKEPGFINSLVVMLKPQVALAGDHIIRHGEIGREMFFLSRGEVEVVSGDGKTVFAKLREGSYFGEIALLFAARRIATIRAVGYCELLLLTKEDFDSVLNFFPSFADSLRVIAKEKIEEERRKREAEANQGNNPGQQPPKTANSSNPKTPAEQPPKSPIPPLPKSPLSSTTRSHASSSKVSSHEGDGRKKSFIQRNTESFANNGDSKTTQSKQRNYKENYLRPNRMSSRVVPRNGDIRESSPPIEIKGGEKSSLKHAKSDYSINELSQPSSLQESIEITANQENESTNQTENKTQSQPQPSTNNSQRGESTTDTNQDKAQSNNTSMQPPSPRPNSNRKSTKPLTPQSVTPRPFPQPAELIPSHNMPTTPIQKNPPNPETPPRPPTSRQEHNPTTTIHIQEATESADTTKPFETPRNQILAPSHSRSRLLLTPSKGSPSAHSSSRVSLNQITCEAEAMGAIGADTDADGIVPNQESVRSFDLAMHQISMKVKSESMQQDRQREPDPSDSSEAIAELGSKGGIEINSSPIAYVDPATPPRGIGTDPSETTPEKSKEAKILHMPKPFAKGESRGSFSEVFLTRGQRRTRTSIIAPGTDSHSGGGQNLGDLTSPVRMNGLRLMSFTYTNPEDDILLPGANDEALSTHMEEGLSTTRTSQSSSENPPDERLLS